MRWILPVLLLAFAGCAAPEQPHTLTVTATATFEREVPVPYEVEVVRANQAPLLALSTDGAEGRLLAPATVQVRVEASDPDGDAVVVELDLDGDGTVEWRGAAPATVEVDLPRPGERRIVATASDGHATARTETSLRTEAPPPFEAEGGYDLGLSSAACGGPPVPPPGAEKALATEWRLDVPAELRNGTLEATFDFRDNRTFRGAVAEFLAGDEVLGRLVGNLTLSGPVPAQAEAIRFSSCGGLGATVRAVLRAF